MNDWLLTLLRMSAAGALTILAVLAARLALRRFPRRYVCLLWLVVLFRLLCPVTLRAPTSVMPETVESGELVTSWTERYAGDTRVILRGEPGYGDALAAGRTPVSGYPPAGPTGRAEAPTAPDDTGEAPSDPAGSDDARNYVVTAADGLSEPKRAGEVWLPVLSRVWLGGAAALLLWSVFKYLRLRFRLREAVKLDKGVYEAEGLASPFVLGVLCPRVYLPWGMAAEDRAWVLRHERAHLKRLDPLWKLLGWLALCIHWFDPFCWLAFFLAVRDMEGACDEAVIRGLDGEERAAYSRLLLSLSAGKPLFAATPLGFGEGNVKQRIKSVLRWRKPKWWMAVPAGVLIAAVALLFAFGPQRRAEPAPEPTPSVLPRYPVEEGWTLLDDGELEAWKKVTTTYPYGYPNNGAGTMDYNQLANNPMSACFTSFYRDPTELDLDAFLRYYYYEESATEAEFRALRDAGKLYAGRWQHIEDLPTPLHRIPASLVEGDLQHFYGIGLRDLKRDYRLCGKYLPEYDCFYTTTSDWGPAVFQPMWGERKDDVVRLWYSQTCLTCQRVGAPPEEGWIILSFWNENAGGQQRPEDPETRPEARRDRYAAAEYGWVFVPEELNYKSMTEGDDTVLTIPAGYRYRVEWEQITPEGEIWLRAELETKVASPIQAVMLRAEDVIPWTEELSDKTTCPVYIPAGVTFYPRTFGYGDEAKASLAECLVDDNEQTHGYDLEGAVVALEDGYALVGFAGGMEVWVKHEDLAVGKPEESGPSERTRMLLEAREKALEMGEAPETWGGELVWHARDGGYYSAYFPLRDSENTLCVVFAGSYESGWTPDRVLLIPPGAEDWQ